MFGLGDKAEGEQIDTGQVYDSAYDSGFSAGKDTRRRPQQDAIMNEASSLTQWMEEVSDVVDRFSHNLRGEVEVKKQVPGSNDYEMVWEKQGRAMLTEKGIQVMVGFVCARVNKVAFLSHLIQHDVYIRCNLAHKDLAEEIANNRKRWEINVEDRDTIIHWTMDIVYIGLMKCVEGREKTFLERIFGESFQSGINQREEQKRRYFGLGGL